MEAAGAVTRRGAFCPNVPGVLRREPRGAGWVGSSRVSVRPRWGFSDEGHLRYYASPATCGRGEEEEKKAMKRRVKLLKGLSALQTMGGGFGVAVAPGGIEERKMAITEAADVLLAQLELLRAEERDMKRKKKLEKAAMRATSKQMRACDESGDSEDELEEMKGYGKMEEMDTMEAAAKQAKDCGGCKDLNNKEMKKRKKKEEKAAMKAATKQVKDCESEDSSSSSSSESSDNDCEGEVVGMSSLRTVPAVHEPATGNVQMDISKGELNLPIAVSRTEERAEGAIALKRPLQCSGRIVNGVGSNTSTCCSDSVANGVDSSTSTCGSSSKGSNPVVMASGAAVNMERIEVCMGGKCKKSGAMELMQEFERSVGIEGVVVSCKCMGKCKEGPNVRVRNMPNGDESGRAVRNPLCIGVGLEDVGTIVANFFAEKDMGLLAA